MMAKHKNSTIWCSCSCLYVCVCLCIRLRLMLMMMSLTFTTKQSQSYHWQWTIDSGWWLYQIYRIDLEYKKKIQKPEWWWLNWIILNQFPFSTAIIHWCIETQWIWWIWWWFQTTTTWIVAQNQNEKLCYSLFYHGLFTIQFETFVWFEWIGYSNNIWHMNICSMKNIQRKENLMKKNNQNFLSLNLHHKYVVVVYKFVDMWQQQQPPQHTHFDVDVNKLYHPFQWSTMEIKMKNIFDSLAFLYSWPSNKTLNFFQDKHK